MKILKTCKSGDLEKKFSSEGFFSRDPLSLSGIFICEVATRWDISHGSLLIWFTSFNEKVFDYWVPWKLLMFQLNAVSRLLFFFWLGLMRDLMLITFLSFFIDVLVKPCELLLLNYLECVLMLFLFKIPYVIRYVEFVFTRIICVSWFFRSEIFLFSNLKLYFRFLFKAIFFAPDIKNMDVLLANFKCNIFLFN